MNGTMTITEAKKTFTTLPEKLSRRKRALAVTRGGKRVLAVMTWEQYEALFVTETRVKRRSSKKVRPWTEEEWREKEKEADEDIKAGRTYGPFDKDEALAFLDTQIEKSRSRRAR